MKPPSQSDVQLDKALGAVLGAGAFGSLIVSSMFRFFGDLWATLKSKGGIDEMRRMDAALARSEVLMIAILADGHTTDDELQQLHQHFANEDVPENALDALRAFSARTAGVATDPEKLSAVVAASAARIPAEAKGATLEAVAVIARELQSASGPRESSHAHVDAPTLVRRIAAALGVTDAERDAALAVLDL